MLTTTDVTLRFADGIEHRIAVAPGRAILDAGLEAGAPLLYQCRSGTCSSCVARLVSGEAHTRAGQSTTLTASERDRGHRLLCVSEAASDCMLELDYDSTAGAVTSVEADAFVNADGSIDELVIDPAGEDSPLITAVYLPARYATLDASQVTLSLGATLAVATLVPASDLAFNAE